MSDLSYITSARLKRERKLAQYMRRPDVQVEVARNNASPTWSTRKGEISKEGTLMDIPEPFIPDPTTP